MRGEYSFDPAMKTKVECFPLYSILLAIGNPQIDLFSLDIEGIILHTNLENYYVDEKKLVFEYKHILPKVNL